MNTLWVQCGHCDATFPIKGQMPSVAGIGISFSCVNCGKLNWFDPLDQETIEMKPEEVEQHFPFHKFQK